MRAAVQTLNQVFAKIFPTCTWECFFFRPEEYKKKVMDYVKKYASEEALRQSEQDAVSSSSESSMSDFSEDEAQVRYFAKYNQT